MKQTTVYVSKFIISDIEKLEKKLTEDGIVKYSFMDAFMSDMISKFKKTDLEKIKRVFIPPEDKKELKCVYVKKQYQDHEILKSGLKDLTLSHFIEKAWRFYSGGTK